MFISVNNQIPVVRSTLQCPRSDSRSRLSGGMDISGRIKSDINELAGCGKTGPKAVLQVSKVTFAGLPQRALPKQQKQQLSS